MTRSSRYCVGIDLGTTNSVVAYVDTLTAPEHGEVTQLFQVEQLVGPDVRQCQPVLPSALLFTADAAQTGWVAGRYASEQQAYLPGKVIASAKSWLCHGGVNREAKSLPWASLDVSAQDLLSPVDAAIVVFSTIRDAWNAEMATGDQSYRLEHQRIVVTVPASFDEVAQELTLRAARAAGFEYVRLLEEPQAAFYRWIEKHTGELRSGAVVVCDVGGGTTDLSLFDVSLSDDELPQITRVAVSDHILLGGDNIDAAIAERLSQQLVSATGREPSFNQRTVLRALARQLKEQVLDPRSPPPAELLVSVPGAGSSLFSGTVSVGLSAADLLSLILEGFFPPCARDTQPDERRGGLREVGLPFARDPRITAHVAAFLQNSSVEAILFNGGTLASPLIRERIVSQIAEWQDGVVPKQLENAELDVAVARGAAWYAFVTERNARKLIVAGYPRSLYLELYRQKRSDQSSALCIVPKGFSSLNPVPVQAEGLQALVGRPVRFQVWSALDRPADALGEVIELQQHSFKKLAPLAAKLSLPDGVSLPEGGRLPVRIMSSLSETGLCKLECKADVEGREVSWQLTFNVRESVDVEKIAALGEPSSPLVQRCIEAIDEFYGKRRSADSQKGPKGLMKDLEQLARSPREDWDVSFMRSLWPALARGITRRSRSLEHEVSWFTLAGFLLRPGFGDPLDPVRVDEAWQVRTLGLAYPRESAVRGAACIFWRRLAGGLDEERQLQLAQDYVSELTQLPTYASELIRMLGALERLPLDRKVTLLRELLEIVRVAKGTTTKSAIAWAVERLGGRVPAYAEIDTALPAPTLEPLLEDLLGLPLDAFSKNDWQRLLVGLARRTGDPRRDVSERIAALVHKRMRALGSSADILAPLSSLLELERAQVSYLLGDKLPAGIEILRPK